MKLSTDEDEICFIRKTKTDPYPDLRKKLTDGDKVFNVVRV